MPYTGHGVVAAAASAGATQAIRGHSGVLLISKNPIHTCRLAGHNYMQGSECQRVELR